jgi:phage baseplate assembly protein W
MARILSYPFRIAGAGVVATVEQNSDQADTEQVAALVLTRLGERPLVPAFGLRDPAFVGIDSSELVAAVARWGPPVRLTDVTATVDRDRPNVTEVRVTFA